MIEEGPIYITTLLKQPALLETSRQLRDEACDILYAQNQFTILIPDCNAWLFVRWLDMVGNDDEPPSRVPSVDVDTDGIPHWKNLMAWCKAGFDGNALGLLEAVEKYDEGDKMDAVIVTAHEYTADSATWEECEQKLLTLQKLAAVLDSRWLAEH